MTQFYVLSSPSLHWEYASSEERRLYRSFALAEWSSLVELPSIDCPLFPGHKRAGSRTSELFVILPSENVGDFVWTWYSECLVTGRVLELFRSEALRGFETRPVSIERVGRLHQDGPTQPPSLWELVVVGRGGKAAPESGIRLIYACPACGMTRYSSYTNGIIVDEEEWDGSDFFTVDGYPMRII